MMSRERALACLAIAGVVVTGCGGGGGVVLDADELARARRGWGSASASIEADGMTMPADAALIVIGGTDPVVLIQWDALTDNADPADLRGRFAVPEAMAAGLATSGWALELGPDDLDATGRPALLEGALSDATYGRVRLRAEPDRLFVMELDVVAAGATRTVSIFGHLAGGCYRDDGGPEWVVVDPASDARCESIFGASVL